MGEFRAALRELSGSQKTPRGVPAYTLYVNRRAGRVLAAAASVARMTPNQVTVVSALFTFSAIALIAAVEPAVWSSILVAVLLVVGYFLDSADGQLARLQRAGSPAGEWLDHVVDCAKIVTLHLAVLVCWYRFYDLDEAMLLVPMGYLLVGVVLFFAVVLTEKLKQAAQTAPRSSHATFSRTRAFVMLPVDYGLVCVAFALLWAEQTFVVVYTALLVANAALLGAYLVKSFRELAPPRREPAADVVGEQV
ncbi:MAG TPA: CDP-alcohol phosphatidyltransferase family protein [Jiangellaceae bacterium]